MWRGISAIDEGFAGSCAPASESCCPEGDEAAYFGTAASVCALGRSDDSQAPSFELGAVSGELLAAQEVAAATGSIG